ncbi:MAG: single-stranded DNA-binding protein, partial [Aliarcobacter sp.]
SCEDKLFIDVVAFNGLADVISKYTKKGSQILIAGELKLETWVSQDGSKKSKHIVQIDDIALLDKKEE